MRGTFLREGLIQEKDLKDDLVLHVTFCNGKNSKSNKKTFNGKKIIQHLASKDLSRLKFHFHTLELSKREHDVTTGYYFKEHAILNRE